MRSIVPLVFAALIQFPMCAQPLDWALAFGGAEYDESQSVSFDGAGNILVTGRFMGTVDLDPGPGVLNATALGDRDVFIQKLDDSGALLWAVSFGGTLRDDGYSIATDQANNVYVTGRFEGTVDFDPSGLVHFLTAIGNRDVYVMKLDQNGSFLWVRTLGEVQNDRGYSIDTDPLGNVYVTGYFAGTADFDPGVGTYDLTSVGEDDVFILKLNSSGDFVWARSLGGTSYDEGWVLTMDAIGNLYITGYFQGTADMDPGPGVQNMTSSGNTDAFVLKLDANGNFLWARSMGGPAFESGHSIHTDPYGFVYTTGAFEGSVDMDPGVANFTVPSSGQSDVFIQKLDGNGNFVWARAIGSTTRDEGYSIHTDGSANVYVTGYFEGTMDADPGPGNYYLTSNGQTDVFVLKLDANGTFVWAASFGGTGADIGYALHAAGMGDVLVTGSFEGTADLDPGVGTMILNSNGQTDVFIQKLNLTAVGIDDQASYNTPFIYPNPATDVIYVDLGTGADVSLRVMNAAGQMILLRENISNGTYPIVLDAAPGVYTVVLTSAGVSSTSKLIKH